MTMLNCASRTACAPSRRGRHWRRWSARRRPATPCTRSSCRRACWVPSLTWVPTPSGRTAPSAPLNTHRHRHTFPSRADRGPGVFLPTALLDASASPARADLPALAPRACPTTATARQRQAQQRPAQQRGEHGPPSVRHVSRQHGRQGRRRRPAGGGHVACRREQQPRPQHSAQQHEVEGAPGGAGPGRGADKEPAVLLLALPLGRAPGHRPPLSGAGSREGAGGFQR
mmetsp:Transcript_41187/g.100488  ORF Transcript_41187/g.100488 Transcript_41187/m.100488 type:complete len:228 (-) Transcript_41187:166-849(-)